MRKRNSESGTDVKIIDNNLANVTYRSYRGLGDTKNSFMISKIKPHYGK